MIWTKDPDSTVKFTFDWSDWLTELTADDTIDSAVINTTTGITAGAITTSATEVTVPLSGGTDGESYTVTCQITTVGGQIDQRSRRVRVREQ